MRAPLLVAVVVLLAGCATPEPGAEGTPAWSFTDTEGAVHSRDSPESNATVLFFFATWCGSCRATAPRLAAVHEDYAERGVRFYSVGFDPTESATDLRGWMTALEQDWPHGLDPGLGIQRTFGITSQSSVVALDADGSVARAWGYGKVTEAELRSTLDAALAA